VARFIAYVLQYAILLIAHLYDAIIMIPIQIERWIRGDKAPSRPTLTAEDMVREAAAIAMQPSPPSAKGRTAKEASAPANRRRARKTSTKKKTRTGGTKRSTVEAKSEGAASSTATESENAGAEERSEEHAFQGEE
jgi:hypothetical protein